MLRKYHRKLCFQSLEQRRMLAFAAEGHLVGIKGTNGDDIMTVEHITSGPHQGDIRLTMNEEEQYFGFSSWSGTSFTDVVLLGKGGNDQITIMVILRFALSSTAAKATTLLRRVITTT
jgi:hypothetical protein